MMADDQCWVLFCAPDTPDDINEARRYCADNNLGQDIVRIVRKGGVVLVEARKGVTYDDFMGRMRRKNDLVA